MQVIDSSSCRTSSGAGQTAATQGSNGLHGSSQDRADALVRATVLSDLGQGTSHGRHSHGIQGVAAAVRKALGGQDVTGTDAADDVLKKIETSLHKAAQKLADRGVDARTIDATIDKFRSQLANALDGTTGAASGTGSSTGSGAAGSGTSAGSGAAGSGSSGTVTGAGSTGTSGASGTTGSTTPAPTPTSTTSVSKFVEREVRKESGAIDLVTAEGDRVSIRFRTKEVVSGSVTQSTAADGTSSTATKGSVFSRGGVKIEVNGDLNADEQKAIGDLLGKVDDIATQFFSGDVQAAFSAAGSLGVDSDQIAAYRLNLTYSRKIAAYGAVASVPVSTQAPASSSAGDGTTSSTGAVTGSTSTTGSTSVPSSAGGTSTASDNSSGASASDPSPAGSTPTTSTTTDAGDSGSGAAGSGTSGTKATGDTSATPPASTAPASAQKTILDFINDALSKLGSVSGAGRVSFSTHWKMSVLVTALQHVQPAQPATAADQTAANNTQLLGDSLQKIAAV